MQSQTIEQNLKPWRLVPGYLEGPVYDNIFIFGVLAIALLSGAIVIMEPQLFGIVLILDLWFLGYHHVIATFTKLAGTPEDRQQNHFMIYYLPFLVLAGTFGLYASMGIWAIVTVYFFWQWYHYTRQAYGISVFYRRKSGIKESFTPSNLDYAAIWAVPVWGLVNRCSQNWDTFIFQPFWTPDLPLELAALVGACAILVLGAWFVTKIIDWQKGQLSFAMFAFMLSHHIAFYVGYVFIGDITIGWLVANVWHNAQYILFVWLFNKNRFRHREGEISSQPHASGGKVMPWLSQPHPFRIMAYFTFCIIMTSIFYKSIAGTLSFISAGDQVLYTGMLIIAYQAINFHHYIVDSYIWKARKKSHQKIMNIKTS